MVRSRYLTPEHLIRAIKAGDFYASSGVTLADVQFDAETKTLSLRVVPSPGAAYQTDFIATLKPDPAKPDDQDRIGKVVATVAGTSAKYQMTGDELYVRAVVTSSLSPADPVFDDQKQQAWTQPVGW